MVRSVFKKSYGFMVLCSLSLLLMLITSCQESKLKAVIEIANKQCPIDMGLTGKVTNITYDGNNVVYTMNINEEFANIKALKNNPENLKRSMQVMFQNPAAEAKTLMELVVECNAGLQMTFIGKESGDKVTCELTTEELKEILNKDTDASESDLAKLESQLKMANLQFPMKASEEVVIEKIDLSDESVIYICNLNEDLCKIQQIEENAEGVKQGIVRSLASQTDQATRLFIKSCLNCNRNIVYRYIGKQSGNHYDVVITIPELQKMLKENK